MMRPGDDVQNPEALGRRSYGDGCRGCVLEQVVLPFVGKERADDRGGRTAPAVTESLECQRADDARRRAGRPAVIAR